MWAMFVTVRLFAVLRDRAGASEVTVELDDDPSVSDVTRCVETLYPELGPLLQKTAVAVNQAYASPRTPVRHGDEVALIPPVSGGCS